MTKPVAPVSSPERKNNDRRVMKPLIEKKRRSRINSSLNELKTLLEVVLGNQIPRDYKLEKADILELTVSHLRSRVSQSRVLSLEAVDKYQIGFSECVSEVSRYLSTVEGTDPDLRPRVIEHLSNRIGIIRQFTTMANQGQLPAAAVHHFYSLYPTSSSAGSPSTAHLSPSSCSTSESESSFIPGYPTSVQLHSPPVLRQRNSTAPRNTSMLTPSVFNHKQVAPLINQQIRLELVRPRVHVNRCSVAIVQPQDNSMWRPW